MNMHSHRDIRILNESDITADLDGRIRHTLSLCFPHRAEEFKHRRWLNHNTPDFSVVIDKYNTIAAHVAVIERMITVGPCQLRVAGVGLVAVHPDHRRQGLTSRVIKLAMYEADRRGYDMGLLFCTKEIKPIYEKNGWKQIHHAHFVHVEHGHHKPFPDERLRLYFPLEIVEFPEGSVNLDGPKW